MKWVLVLREGMVFGPFDSEIEAEEHARVIYGDDYEHAETNDDFFTCELQPV